MAEPERKTLLKRIKHYSPELAETARDQPLENLGLLHQVLRQHSPFRTGMEDFPQVIYNGLKSNVFRKNFGKILKLLQKMQSEVGPAYDTTVMIAEGTTGRRLTEDNLQQFMDLLDSHAAGESRLNEKLYALVSKPNLNAGTFSKILSMLRETEEHGHDPAVAGQVLINRLKSRALNSRNADEVLAEALAHAREGASPVPLLVFLGKNQKNVKANLDRAREAREPIVKAARLLHGIQHERGYEKVTNKLFDQVLRTHKTRLPEMGEKKYWQWIGLHAKQLKANVANVK